MLEFEIGFEVDGSFFEKKQLKKRYLENRVEEKRNEDTVYLQYKGFFLQLFQHYHLVDKSVSPVVTSFKIPERTPKWFNHNELQNYYYADLVEVTPTLELPLQEYIRKKSPDKIEPHAGEIAVIRGNTYNIFSIMGGVRGDKTTNPVKTWEIYDEICRRKKLPALLPHLAYR